MVIRLIVAKVKDSQFIVICFGIYSDSKFQFDYMYLSVIDYMYLSVYFAKKTKNDVNDIKMHSRNACACKNCLLDSIMTWILKKPRTSNSSCSRREPTTIREFYRSIYLKLAQN